MVDPALSTLAPLFISLAIPVVAVGIVAVLRPRARRNLAILLVLFEAVVVVEFVIRWLESGPR
jgi:hypothetical protein